MKERTVDRHEQTYTDRFLLSPRVYCLLLVLLFLFSFFIRLVRYEDVVDKDRILFIQVDSYYHMRRVHASIPHWPWLLQYDSYLDHPHGAGVVLAPGFGFMLATAGLIAGGGQYNPQAVDLAAALLPPFLGALVIFSIALVARRLFGNEAAIWACVLFAVMKGGIWPATFGSADHHVAEFLFTPLLFAAFLAMLKDPAGKINRREILNTVLLAIAVATSQLVWRGAIAYTSVFIASSLFLLIWRRFQSRNSDVALKRASTLPFLGISLGLLATVIMIYPWCSSSWFGKQGMIVYYALSWFHPLYYLAWSVAALALYLLCGGFHCFSRRTSVLLICSFVLITFVIIIVSPARPAAVLNVLLEGVAYLHKSDVWMQTIAETKPLFQENLSQALSTLARYCGLWCILIPFLLPFLFRGNNTRMHRTFLIVWLLFNYLLTFTQLRYNHQLTVTLCILGGWCLFQCRTWLTRFMVRRLETGVKMTAAAFILTGFFALFMTLPSLMNLASSVETRGLRMDPLSPSLVETFSWFDTQTPPTPCFDNPDCSPEYGIMSLWDFGNWLLYYGKRPIVASNFGFLHKGLATSSEFLSTPAWSGAEDIIKQNSIRYILLGDFLRRAHQHGLIYADLTGNPHPLLNGGRPVSDLIYRSDALADSAIDGEQGIREHLRLRYESQPTISHLNLLQPMIFKIFEYVPGCLIAINAKPHLKISLAIPLVTNTGRRFIYRRDAVTDGQGHLMIRVPYATDNGNDPADNVHASEHCRLTLDGKQIELVIPEKDVLAGNQITLTGDAFTTSGETRQYRR